MRPSATVSILLVSALALVLRLAMIVGVGFNPSFFDADSYHYFAEYGLRDEPIPSHYHPPGYSWLLAKLYSVAGPRPRIAYAVQAFLSAVAVWLAGDAARRRFGPRAGLLTATLIALNGYLAIFPSILASETVALFGVTLVTWLLLSSWPAPSRWVTVCVVLLAGSLGLVRTGLVLLALPALYIEAVRSRAERRILLGAVRVAALLLLAAGPIVTDAWLESRRTGVFELGAATDTANFWAGNNPAATGRMEAFPDAPIAGTPDFPDERACARHLSTKVRQFLLEYPERQLILIPMRASYLFAPAKRDLIYVYGHGWAGERPAETVFLVYIWVAVSVPLLAAGAILGFARAGHTEAVRLALGMVLLGALPYLASIGDARYVQPFQPVLAIVAGASAGYPLSGGWSRNRRLAAAAVALLFFGNAAYDVKKTEPALAAIARAGGSTLRPPYIFAR